MNKFIRFPCRRCGQTIRARQGEKCHCDSCRQTNRAPTMDEQVLSTSEQPPVTPEPLLCGEQEGLELLFNDLKLKPNDEPSPSKELIRGDAQKPNDEPSPKKKLTPRQTRKLECEAQVGVLCESCLKVFQVAPAIEVRCPSCGTMCQAPTQAEVIQPPERSPASWESLPKTVTLDFTSGGSRKKRFPLTDWVINLLYGVWVVGACAVMVLVPLYLVWSFISFKPDINHEQLRIKREARERIDKEDERMEKLLREIQVQEEIERQRRGR